MENISEHHHEHVPHVVHANEQERMLEERKQKVMAFFKKKKDWIYYILLAIVIWFSGIYIRTLNVSGLKDVTTGQWTLAPDLDPFLFLRWAKEIVAHGSLPAIDLMRYVPSQYQTSGELPFVSYGIAYLYKIMHAFSSKVTVEYAAIMFPVVFFCLAMIAFFFFVRELFVKYKNANLIALISTALLGVIPGFVHRTIAGVPEKESAAFVFMFLAFYFILKAWHSGNWKKSALFGMLAGVMTAIMGLAWGGVTFMFVSIGLSAFVAFFVSDFKKKDKLAYLLWVASFTIILYLFGRIGAGLFQSTTSMIAYAVLGLFIADSVLYDTKIHEKLRLDRLRIPKRLITLIVLVLVGIIGLLIVEPTMIGHFASDIYANLFKSFEGNRFTLTVAENNKPYFNSWGSSFGYLFWIFFLGSILLFYEEIKHFERKQRWNIVIAYTVLIFGIVFTRYSSTSILNGESFLSNVLFVGSMLWFAVVLLYEYFKKEDFSIDVGLIFLLSTFFFALLSARGAIRLLYFLYPIAPIIVAFVVVRLSEFTFENKDETFKIMFGILALASILLTAYSFYQFSGQSIAEAKGSVMVGNPYYMQWQYAMNWTRENTPKDAVFTHWWDYGYWVQSIGERATVVDGGNFIVYWDHLVGRNVLTASNEESMLEFMKTHKSDYLLIDSSDIGKYPAFSSIGSDENCSQYSWIPTFSTDESNIVEKRNETVYVLRGGTMLDEDLVYKNQIFPKENYGVGAVMVSIKKDNESVSFNQPKAVIVGAGKQVEIPIKCAYFNNQKMMFGDGMDACIYLMPRVSQTGVIPIGGGLWLGPKLMRSEFSKLYLFNETDNFELVHSEESVILKELNSKYNLNLPEFTLYGGELLGPIKIWKANFPSDIQENPEFLKTVYPNEDLEKKMCR